MFTFLLDLSPRSELVVKSISYIFKVSEEVLPEQIEPMIYGSLKVRRECLTEKEIIMSIDCHLVFELAEMQKRVSGSRVVIEGGHHKFSQKTESGDFL